ncbi:hypothetical protein Nepgr_021403 [Nepenthes gracilis]|uniref:Uncharacterized protein n=1 Tax=Nepenthes gracilis TaxID=150966 RepID=A0AAD3SZN4_NEPGR|nr:hypothetical protein Nepgr_021403 [Nepenthes gracilis]
MLEGLSLFFAVVKRVNPAFEIPIVTAINNCTIISRKQAASMPSFSPIKQGSFHVAFPEPDPEDAKIAETIETELDRLEDLNGLDKSL